MKANGLEKHLFAIPCPLPPFLPFLEQNDLTVAGMP